jgi:hypothetical protein
VHFAWAIANIGNLPSAEFRKARHVGYGPGQGLESRAFVEQRELVRQSSRELDLFIGIDGDQPRWSGCWPAFAATKPARTSESLHLPVVTPSLSCSGSDSIGGDVKRFDSSRPVA